MSVKTKICLETINNLNNSTCTLAVGTADNAPAVTDGLYATINNAIASLVAIKNGVKTQEKHIITALTLEAQTETGLTAEIDADTAVNNVTVADVYSDAGYGHHASRYEDGSDTVANYPAVLVTTTTTKKYAEDIVLSLIHI